MSPAEKEALDKTNCDMLQKICGYANAFSAKPQQVDNNGEPVYSERVGPDKIITPAWKLTPELNWEKWSQSFLPVFGRDIFTHFKTVTWPQHRKYAMQKENGTFNDNVEKHKKQNLMNTQTNTLLTKQSATREGTCVAGKEFDPLLQYVNPDDKKHVVQIEPKWISDAVNNIKGGLDQVGELSGKDTTSINYLKRNMPIEAPGAGKQDACWMIGDDWIDSHPYKWGRKKFMFDPKAKVAPNFSNFVKLVGKAEQLYLEETPEWLQQQLDANFTTPSWSVSPLVLTHSRSATRLMAMSKAPHLLPPFHSLHPAESPTQSLRPAQPNIPMMHIDHLLFNPVGAALKNTNHPAHLGPGNITGVLADGRPLYSHSGDPRYLDMPSPHFPDEPQAGLLAKPVNKDFTVGGSSGLKGKKMGNEGEGKGKKLLGKKGKGGAEKGVETESVILCLPHPTRSTAKKS
ncbi:hypothetical protein FRC07_004273 [Ceratobasidium sp. 392]|nr:hypothetical protein FRC07_004273 [Ceratobasidium sp. 392]